MLLRYWTDSFYHTITDHGLYHNGQSLRFQISEPCINSGGSSRHFMEGPPGAMRRMTRRAMVEEGACRTRHLPSRKAGRARRERTASSIFFATVIASMSTKRLPKETNEIQIQSSLTQTIVDHVKQKGRFEAIVVQE